MIDGDIYCTLTSIGTDKTGALIGFTSAHCGGPGAQVASESAPAAGVLGTMVAGNDGLDYAVIKFGPAKGSRWPTGVVSPSTDSVRIPRSATWPANWDGRRVTPAV